MQLVYNYLKMYFHYLFLLQCTTTRLTRHIDKVLCLHVMKSSIFSKPQVPQCISPTSHSVHFCNRNVQISVTKWYIVGYLFNVGYTVYPNNITHGMRYVIFGRGMVLADFAHGYFTGGRSIWRIWVNYSHQFTQNCNIIKTKQRTTKPCVFFHGIYCISHFSRNPVIRNGIEIIDLILLQDYDTEDIEFMKHAILEQWDLNHDGRINKAELTMLLLQQGRLALESQETAEDDSEDE